MNQDERTEFGEAPASATKVRIRGLVLLAAGALLTPVFFVLAYLLGLLLASLFGDGGPVRIAVGLVALPLVMAFIGWLELVTGVPFRRLQKLFEKAGLARLGITLHVLASAGALLAGFLYMYGVASARGWF
jgi:hypothetical protein